MNDSDITSGPSATRLLHFAWPDYCVFCFMLVISAAIGIYFGCFGSRQKSAAEYLLGGKKMQIFPVSMSLVASHVSGISLLGIPSEIYVYGTQYWMFWFPTIVVCILVNVIYLPVFHKLQLTSTFEYFELRFGPSVRLAASFLFTLFQVLYIPIVIYLPALAFSQVSGVNLHAVTPIVSCICIFYTMMGGIKAVVWTDFIQQMIMMGASIVVIILGLVKIGGISRMWDINVQGDRIEFFNMDPSIFARLTFFTTSIGWIFNYLAVCGVSQSMVQRFLAVPTLRAAKISMIIFTIGMIICKSISCLTGLLIHAQYHDCDPETTKTIQRQDQLLPYYVMDVTGNVPGLPGLFVAGVFSAALSTMSTCLNTISGTIYEDFLSLCLSKRTREKHASLLMKIIVFIMGTMCVAMVFLIERLGSALQMTISLNSITMGALLGLFTLGMVCPWANTKGALSGGLTSLIFVSIIVIGSQSARATNQLAYSKKPVSTDGCLNLVNNTHAERVSLASSEEPFILFKISFMYFNTIGCLTVLIVGIAVSFLTGSTDLKRINRDLLSPIVHRWLPARKENKNEPTEEPLLVIRNAM